MSTATAAQWPKPTECEFADAMRFSIGRDDRASTGTGATLYSPSVEVISLSITYANGSG